MNQPFHIGDRVSLDQWDQTVKPWQCLGTCSVVGIRPSQSESGWLVTVQANDQRTTELDSNWIKPIGEQGELKL